MPSKDEVGWISATKIAIHLQKPSSNSIENSSFTLFQEDGGKDKNEEEKDEASKDVLPANFE